MANVELIMPKMGESIMEATILKWLKNEGDTIEEEESVLEIATDKVDSEVPSPVAGVLTKRLFGEGETVSVGKAIALIAIEKEATNAGGSNAIEPGNESLAPQPDVVAKEQNAKITSNGNGSEQAANNGFYSPLVLNMAKEENIAMAELAIVPGTGKNGRLTKKDMLKYISNRGENNVSVIEQMPSQQVPVAQPQVNVAPPPSIDKTGNVEIVEMDRMRRLIADHMVMSKSVSPHVTSFVEVDVTNIVNWRNRVKERFLQREGEKITFTPIFAEAVIQAIKEHPMVNASVDGSNIIIRKDVNLGMATALPSGNLIVPVIKNADRMNLAGLAKTVNDLAARARSNKLKPDEVQGGTFTLTNVGTFGSLMGTPIINQPQVAILATGIIRKKPAVLETEHGDVIAIRHMMIMSMSYDHRIVDGAMGSTFLRRVADYLEAFDVNREV